MITPEDLINEKQILTQSNHTLFDQFHVHNDKLAKLAHYACYRKGGVKVGRALNPLEAFAMDIIDNHAENLALERIIRKVCNRYE